MEVGNIRNSGAFEMDETFYSEQEIEELRAEHKWYIRIHYLFLKIFYMPLLVLLSLTNHLVGWFDTYGYYDKAGSFHYVSNISNIVTAVLYVVVILIACFLICTIFKKVFKEKYTEFEVAIIRRNIEKRKYRKISNRLETMFFIIILAFLSIVRFNELTCITLSNNDFQIKCHNYGTDIEDTFNYNCFNEIAISVTEYGNLICLIDENSEYKIKTINIGKRTKYQDELLKTLDEKTNNKFELLKNAAEADGL